VPSEVRGLVLIRDRDDLHARIAIAVAQRLAAGAIDEIRRVRDLASATARQILGWREIGEYLDGKILREECRERLTTATRQYAKRQLTWFRAKSTFPKEIISTVTPDHLDRLARRLGLS
jgi:tRNA dimethylallyltransferase